MRMGCISLVHTAAQEGEQTETNSDWLRFVIDCCITPLFSRSYGQINCLFQESYHIAFIQDTVLTGVTE